jgi:zinc transport system substrate-binding protein
MRMILALVWSLMRTVGVGALLVALTLGVTACDRGTESKGDGRVGVVASFYPLAEIAGRVGGDTVVVKNLTPPGVEPHDIELTSRDVDALHDADLILYLGAGFQPAVAEIASRRDEHGIDVLGAVVTDKQAAADPHFWLDPTLMSAAVDTVTAALVDAFPAHRTTYRANAERYKDELAALDGEFAKGLEQCDRREILTAHEAFFYLTRRYHLRQLAIAGVSPEAEPDADRLAALADQIGGKGITTVFFEELVSPKVAEALAREANVKTDVLNPVEGLTDAERADDKDYVAVMRENLASLRRALSCR